MANLPVCTTDGPFEGLYVEFLVLSPLILVLQFMLLMSSIYYELTNRKASTISLSSRVIYFMLQLFAIYFVIADICRFVLDPKYHILSSPAMCKIAAHSQKIMPSIFYATYLYLVLSHLTDAFKDTAYALTQCQYRTFSIIIFVGYALIVIVFFALNWQSTCYYAWTPPDYKHDGLRFCGYPAFQRSRLVIIAGIMFTVALVMTFCGLFYYKAFKLLRENIEKGSERVEFETKCMILKFLVLVLTGSFTTVISWSIWLSSFKLQAVFLHLDLFINCLTIGLMYKHMERLYVRMCKICIFVAFACCQRSAEDGDDPHDNVQALELHNYLWSKDSVVTNITLEHSSSGSGSRSDDGDATQVRIVVTSKKQKPKQKNPKPREQSNSGHADRNGYALPNVHRMGTNDPSLAMAHARDLQRVHTATYTETHSKQHHRDESMMRALYRVPTPSQAYDHEPGSRAYASHQNHHRQQSSQAMNDAAVVRDINRMVTPSGDPELDDKVPSVARMNTADLDIGESEHEPVLNQRASVTMADIDKMMQLDVIESQPDGNDEAFAVIDADNPSDHE